MTCCCWLFLVSFPCNPLRTSTKKSKKHQAKTALFQNLDAPLRPFARSAVFFGIGSFLVFNFHVDLCGGLIHIISVSFFLCAGTPNRDDRVSPAWVSACSFQHLCAGCGLGEHLISNLSFGKAFPCNPLQTYVNSSLYLFVLGLKAFRFFFFNLRPVQILI